MKFLNLLNQFWEYIIGALSLGFIRTKFGRFLFKKLADALAKPIYDWVIRKGYIVIKKEQAEKKEKEFKDAKTKDDVVRTFNDLP